MMFRISILLFLLLLFQASATELKSLKFDKYVKAYNLIINSSEFTEFIFTNGTEEICLSREVLPYYVLGKYFLEKLNLDMISYANLYGSRDFREELCHNKSFKKINRCEVGVLMVYFTNFHENMVFAEVLFQNEKKSRYGSSTVLGESISFCIEFNDDQVKNYSVKKIMNN